MGAPGKKNVDRAAGCHSHEEIAAHFGITKTRVQQIEKRALEKLRRKLRAQRLELR